MKIMPSLPVLRVRSCHERKLGGRAKLYTLQLGSKLNKIHFTGIMQKGKEPPNQITPADGLQPPLTLIVNP